MFKINYVFFLGVLTFDLGATVQQEKGVEKLSLESKGLQPGLEK